MAWLEGGAMYSPSASQNLRFGYAALGLKY